jgi:hypothetical protein
MERVRMKNREEIFNLIEKSLKICRNNFIDHVANYENSYFENLISFLPFYCSMIQIRDNAYKNGSLQKFLSIQNDCNNRNFFTIHFIEGYPFEICLAAEFIEDLDLSSVLTITQFEKMILYKNRHRPSSKWTEKEAKAIVKSIKKDIEFDYKIKKIAYANNRDFEVDVKVEKSPIDLLVWQKAYQEAKRIWRRLASSKYSYIRLAVAGVNLIPIDLIKKLATDKNINVLFNLALNECLYWNQKNSKIKVDILEKLNSRFEKCKTSKIDEPEFLANKLLRLYRSIECKNKIEHRSIKSYFCQITRRLSTQICDKELDFENENICNELLYLIDKNCSLHNNK